VRRADNLYHLHVQIVLKYGSFNLLEPSGRVQVCNGIALPFLAVELQGGFNVKRGTTEICFKRDFLLKTHFYLKFFNFNSVYLNNIYEFHVFVLFFYVVCICLNLLLFLYLCHLFLL